MIIDKKDLLEAGRTKRLNIVNSLSGIKSANLIGTRSIKGLDNLAIFNSVVHIGSSPPLVGLVARPSDDVRRDTIRNIRDTGEYTINHVGTGFVDRAHATSAKFEESISEFDSCKLDREEIRDFGAPFVAESTIKMAVSFEDEILIPSNRTSLLIGKIEFIVLPEEIVGSEGYLDIERANTVGVCGLNTYFRLSKIRSLPYARPEDSIKLHTN